MVAPQRPWNARYRMAGIRISDEPAGRKAASVAATPQITAPGSPTSAKPIPTMTPWMSAVATEPNTTARVTSPRYLSSWVRRAGSVGMSRVSDSTMVRPSRRKKNSMKSMMKKPTSVPNTPSAIPPPMLAAPFSTLSRPSLTHPSTWEADTEALARTQSTRPPIMGSLDSRSSSSAELKEASVWSRRYWTSRATWPAKVTPSTDSGTSTKKGVSTVRMPAESEHHRPADHAEERIEQLVERVTQDRRGDDLEAAAVEGRMHGAKRNGNRGARRLPAHGRSFQGASSSIPGVGHQRLRSSRSLTNTVRGSGAAP